MFRSPRNRVNSNVSQIERWAQTHGVPIRHFAKGENKEAIARPLIDAAAKAGGEGRVVLIGVAQEKAPACPLCQPDVRQLPGRN